MSLKHSLLLAAMALTACLAIVSAFTGIDYETQSDAPAPDSGQWLPDDTPGWIWEDKPLGATESTSESARKTLKLDAFLHRNYRKGSKDFTVYIAYWKAGKMPIQLVASHTPDRCWTENGWTCLDSRYNIEKQIDGKPLEPAQWRKFEVQNTDRYVIYWHLIGGKLYDYGERLNAVPHPLHWIRDALQSFFIGMGEQYFIRIDSSHPIESYWQDEGFRKVMRRIAEIGIYAE